MNAWKPKYTPREILTAAAQALGITGISTALMLALLMI